MIKKISTLILIAIIAVGMAIYYLEKYTYSTATQDAPLFLYPFQPDQESFDRDFKFADDNLAKGDTFTAVRDYIKSLSYRNTYNEKQYEERFSDGNDFWEYKLDKLLKYSKCYEFTGNIDSAITCLSNGLVIIERVNFPIEKRFFELLLKTRSRKQILIEISRGLCNVKTLDCFMCDDYYYLIYGYKIGINKSELDMLKTNKQKLIDNLCNRYEL